MKRLTLALGVVLLVSAASEGRAGVIADVERWFGIHCGNGIHAHNGCGPNQGYTGYGMDANYPEEVAPGVSEMDELKNSRRPTPRTSRAYLPATTPKPATR